MATWNNSTKASTSFTNGGITNVATWGDAFVSWADPGIAWGAYRGDAYVNGSKASTSFSNQVKN